MRRLVCAALLVGCGKLRHGADAGTDAGDAQVVDASAPDAAPPAPPEYRSEAFRIEFPEGKAPEVEEKLLPKNAAAVHLYKVQYGSGAYVVLVEDVAESAHRSVDELLQGARDGVLESTGGTPQSDAPVTSGALRGFELVLSATTSGLKLRQRVRVLAGPRRLFQLLVVTPEWSGSTPVEQRFFDSFQPALDGGL